MGLSTVGESLILTALLTGRFVSLHIGDPGNTGANEVTTVGTAYVRQPATFVQVGNNPMLAENDGAVEFPVATADYSGVADPVTHFGIWTLVAGGDFLGGDALTIDKVIEVDDVARFRDGELEFETD